MAYPQDSVETNDGKFVETLFTLNEKRLRLKTNLTTGAADFYLVSVEGDKLIASTDVGNNWNIKNDINLIDSLSNIPTNLINTQQKRIDYFNQNYPLKLNRYRADILNTKYPDGNQTTFANTPGYGDNPTAGGTGDTIPSTTGNIFENIGNLLEIISKGGLPDIPEFDSAGDNSAFKRAGPLKYPQDLDTKHQDTLVIDQYEYQSPNQDIFNTGNISNILLQGIERGSTIKNVKKKPLGQVILPIPNNPQDSNSVNWNSDDMDALKTAATALTVQNPLGTLGGLAAGASASALAKILPAGVGSGIGDLLGNTPPAALRAYLLAQGNTSTSAAALYSYILGKYGFDVSPESILARGKGVVPNSNMQLLFNNVTLRSFTFSYMMSPRSKSEAQDINMILRFFKQGMAARKQGTGNLFLGTPNVFKLEYRSGNSSIAGMNKFKICALTGFQVNYAPSGQWAAYDDGQPASIVMSMAFKELEPIFETDYKDDSKLPIDRPPVKANEIGY